ncbi:MAG: hypothetical protein JOZ80_06790 [Acidobacteriaceae bacterium]|nr:hypothetical protein [Acidobacteriaceae bacterium]
MSPESKQKIQLVLAFAIIVAGARTGYILYERHSAKMEQARLRLQSKPIDPDYYVIPKKLYPYDLKSSRQLVQQPVWVKEGYRYTYNPYENHRTDFAHDAGKLLPLQKLQIKDVVLDHTPGSPGEQQLMAVFEDSGKTYAFPIGSLRNGNYQIYSDEMLYIQDPHELYKHWSRDVWQAIDQHQVKSGMSELQTDFAIGMGIPEPSTSADVKTVNYPNGGKPFSITFRDGKAAEIRQS